MAELQQHLRSIPLNKSLFGNKPVGLELWQNGLEVKFKKEAKQYLFSDIAALKTADYFLPNPTSYTVELLTVSGEKTVLAISYQQFDDLKALLAAHRDYVLGSDFPAKIMTSTYVLDDHLTWEAGTLVYRGRKGAEEYPREVIADFVMKNGSNFFTLKDSKETLMVGVNYSPNLLIALSICHAIVGKA